MQQNDLPTGLFIMDIPAGKFIFSYPLLKWE